MIKEANGCSTKIHYSFVSFANKCINNCGDKREVKENGCVTTVLCSDVPITVLGIHYVTLKTVTSFKLQIKQNVIKISVLDLTVLHNIIF